MKNISMAFGFLLVIHQFFYLPNIFDSFYISKWALICSGFIAIYVWYLKESSKQSDLQIGKESKLLLLACSSVFLISDFYHDNFYLAQTVGVCTFTYCMTYFVKRTGFELTSISGVITSLLSLSCLLEILGYSSFQGDTYHLSVFTGNPNLFAACLVFWFCIHKKQLSNKQSKISSLFILILLILSKSRAGIIAFIVVEIVFFLHQNKRSRALFLGVSLLLISFFMINNPYHIDEFSSLNIRKIEAKVSFKILENNLWAGIGQGNYRKAYFSQLEASSQEYKSFEDSPSLRFIRLSEMSHFTPLSILVSLGLPLGLLFLILAAYFLYRSYTVLELSEFLGLFSVVIMSMTYYLFHFSVVLIPCLVLVAKVLSHDIQSTGSLSVRRYLPLVLMLFWLSFCISALKYQFDSTTDYKSQLSSSFNQGRLDHRVIEEMLESRQVVSEGQFLKLLDKAHRKMPDPVTFYNASKYFYLIGNNKKAFEYLQRGIEILPSYSSYYYARALMTADPLQACLDYSLVLQMDRKFVPAWKNAAIIQLETGYLQEGLYSIKKGLQFYQEKNTMKNLSTDAYYHQLLQIQAALKQKIKETK